MYLGSTRTRSLYFSKETKRYKKPYKNMFREGGAPGGVYICYAIKMFVFFSTFYNNISKQLNFSFANYAQKHICAYKGTERKEVRVMSESLPSLLKSKKNSNNSPSKEAREGNIRKRHQCSREGINKNIFFSS